MPLSDVATIEASIDIDAPPAAVWSLVSDLRNMRRWSPQCRLTIVRGGVIREGAKMINLNRRGLLVWPTQSMVTELVPDERIAFRVRDNWTVWSFTLVQNASGGTTLVQRREAPRGISDISVRLTKAVLGGADEFAAELEEGMNQTLVRIKVDTEGVAVEDAPAA